MKKCLLVINTKSGNAKKTVDNKKLIDTLSNLYGEVCQMQFGENDLEFDFALAAKGYEVLAVCGGDGTFNNALNAMRNSNTQLVYIPCGTFNDAAHTLNSIKDLEDLSSRRLRQVDLGEFNNTLFSYVAAAGTFTPIGYLPRSKHKKAFGRLVYYLHALKQYKIEKIEAKITTETTNESGEWRVESGVNDLNNTNTIHDSRFTIHDTFTLIMAVKSRYVFGFKFNKIYEHNSGKGHLLLIKSPTGLFKRTKLFFLFFRAFFIGFKKEVNTKNLKFLTTSAAKIELKAEVDFCVDGERAPSGLVNYIKFHQKAGKIYIPNCLTKDK